MIPQAENKVASFLTLPPNFAMILMAHQEFVYAVQRTRFGARERV